MAGNHAIHDPVPTAVVAPILEDILSRHEIYQSAHDGSRQQTRRTIGTDILCQLIARKTGLNKGSLARQLNRILSGETKIASITNVDRYLTELDSADLWYHPPLREWYFAGIEDPSTEGLTSYETSLGLEV